MCVVVVVALRCCLPLVLLSVILPLQFWGIEFVGEVAIVFVSRDVVSDAGMQIVLECNYAICAKRSGC